MEEPDEVMPPDMHNQFQNLHALYEQIEQLAETMADRLKKSDQCPTPLSLFQEPT